MSCLYMHISMHSHYCITHPVLHAYHSGCIIQQKLYAGSSAVHMIKLPALESQPKAETATQPHTGMLMQSQSSKQHLTI